ncbi:circadian clock-controlled protein daywake-like [Anticarsia gemmatalis]|uniref:circadian clock-controlled protein daywake-like n=1 Tax=Anticarsia gemmatalis TaxID=129554 RepID=UPI003F75D600
MWKQIFLCVSFTCLASCSLAPFITPCKWDDEKCLKDDMVKAIPIFVNGIPELKVENMNPMKIKRINADNPNIKLVVTDAQVTGLENCEAKKLSRDIEKDKIMVKAVCTCNFEAHYDMDGQLFVLPIKGNGGLHAKINKLVFNVDVDVSEYEKDGKKHWKVKSWKYTFEQKDKSEVRFDNLFPDNELLRTTTNDLIAKSGNEVIEEIGQPIITAIIAKVIKNIEKFFTAVPLEDLILE